MMWRKSSVLQTTYAQLAQFFGKAVEVDGQVMGAGPRAHFPCDPFSAIRLRQKSSRSAMRFSIPWSPG